MREDGNQTRSARRVWFGPGPRRRARPGRSGFRVMWGRGQVCVFNPERRRSDVMKCVEQLRRDGEDEFRVSPSEINEM